MPTAIDSPLVDFARTELARLGEDQDVTDGLCAVVEAFAAVSHSGTSAHFAANILDKLLRYQPLTALTDDPAEWIDRSAMSGYPIWQSARDPRAMSGDGGKTYTLVDATDGRVHTSEPANR